jgi:predicted MFS family arabinose efflux permease
MLNVLLMCLGFAMTYGIFQEYYIGHWSFQGSQSTVGVIGMTYNGIIYLSMPILFACFTRRWARFRRIAALAGILVSCASFLVCSFSTRVWQLILAQGILAAIGGALIYTSSTLSLGEHYTDSGRAVAYGVTLSSKNVTGTACTFLMQALLDRFGFKPTMWVWTAIVASMGFAAVALMPMVPSDRSSTSLQRSRRIPWDFLHHKTFYIYSIAIMLQSSGYGIPQTYLNSYAHEVASLSINTATLLITL